MNKFWTIGSGDETIENKRINTKNPYKVSNELILFNFINGTQNTIVSLKCLIASNPHYQSHMNYKYIIMN